MVCLPKEENNVNAESISYRGLSLSFLFYCFIDRLLERKHPQWTRGICFKVFIQGPSISAPESPSLLSPGTYFLVTAIYTSIFF